MTAVTQIMSAEAEAAAQRYGLLVEGWRSLFQRALDEADFGSRKQESRIVEQAYAIARTFLDTEGDTLDRVLLEIASEAHTATLSDLAVSVSDELPDDVSAHLSDVYAHLHQELTIQIERDIAFLRQSVRKTHLQVTLAARSARVSMRSALIQYRIGNASELHFFFHDRGNRKWPTRKFVRALWRHNLLSLYNETVLLTLADHGVEHAEVQHLDPNARSHGMVVAMSSGSSHPTYAEIREEIFHPNSDAILKREGA